MRALRGVLFAFLAAGLLAPVVAPAVDSPASAPAAPGAPSADRLVISGNGSTLTGASGGGGGSLAWLHDFNSAVLGVAGEYQTLATAHWAFGSLSGSVTSGSPGEKWAFSGDVHFGTGGIGTSQGLRHFDYDVEGAGVSGTFGGKLTVQLEDRQYDIYTTHGMLPKIALGYLWTPHLQTTVSYSRSVTGNLGTELETLRIDHYGRAGNWLVGGATGHVAPPIINVYTGLLGPAPRYREGFLGLSKTFSGTGWSILGDYLNVAGEKRLTLTVVCTLHVGSSTQ